MSDTKTDEREPARPRDTPHVGDRYSIEVEIGRGGMGRVFRAHDRRLGRDVAIKMLPPGVHPDQALRRFEQEARAAGSLEHPNIVAVHDIGTEGGAPYIVSELLHGATLRHRLDGKALPVPVALDHSRQLALGLEAAHGKGVIHRDLKPENLFVTDDGRIKILDFGIAKLVGSTEAEAARPHTKTGAIVGTAGYMSPEQVRGEAVDHRSDLFAFGAILFEMLAGRAPFGRETAVDTNHAILHDAPPELPGHVPAALDAVVRRCLEKDPARRFQSAHEILRQLALVPDAASPRRRRGAWRWASAGALLAAAAIAMLFGLRRPAPAAAPRIRVAAADFVNETKDEELNGLSSMLITSLDQSKRLQVLTRGRMLVILKQLGRGDAERIDEQLGREISRRASAQALVLTSIRRFGETYAIDLKVVDPIKDEHLLTASERGQGKESIPAMIDRLGARMREGLNEKVEDIRAASVPVERSTTANLEAYQHYFKGEQIMARVGDTMLRNREHEQALDEFRTAIKLDPRFALAHFQLAFALGWPSDEPEATKAADTARRLGLPLREGCLLEAWDSAEAIKFDECAGRFPDSKQILFQAGVHRSDAADIGAAAGYLEKALVLDPTDASIVEYLLFVLQGLDRPDRAIEVATAYAARVHDDRASELLAAAQHIAGQPARAMETLREAARLFPNSPRPRERLARAHLIAGDADKAEDELRPLLDDKLGLWVRFLDVYRGRFRRAEATLDEAIARARKKGNARGAAALSARKAFLVGNGPADLPRAARIAEEVEADAIAAGGDATGNLFVFWCNVMADPDRAARFGRSMGAVGVLFLDAARERRRGPSAEAVAKTEKTSRTLGVHHGMLLRLAVLHLDRREPGKAIAALLKLQARYPFSDQVFTWSFPRSFYRLGQAYEAAGDKPAALRAYDRFLSIWKDADPDLGELRDAKARAAALRRAAP